MKTIFLLIGVRGAGKNTLLNNLDNDNDSSIKVLTTCSTITPRSNEKFVNKISLSSWDDNDFLYHIYMGKNKNGLKKSEVDNICNSQIGITVYDLASFNQISDDQRKNPNIQFVTIGIDTVKDIDEQKTRVNNDIQRTETKEDFEKYKKIIQQDCSITIKGTDKELVEQIKTIANLFIHGGVISGINLLTLLNNNILIDNCHFDEQKTECASYNMHLGSQYKNSDKDPKNRMKDALNNDGLLEIEPYSYIIVQPTEKIILPTFVTAKFDLTVGVFQKGVILSASTQVDPGFKGVITCLLYNPSDSKITLKVNDEFLTIEFYTTTVNTTGYKGKRNDKTLTEQLSSEAIIKSSNKLFKLTREKTLMFILIKVVVPIATVLIPCIFSFFECKKAKEEVESLQQYINNNFTAKNESTQTQTNSNNFYFTEPSKEEPKNESK